MLLGRLRCSVRESGPAAGPERRPQSGWRPSIGLVLGGVPTEAADWHWVFFVNMPIGILAILPAVKILDADPGTGWRNGADWLGAFLVTAGLMLGVYAIVGTSRYGWGSGRAWCGRRGRGPAHRVRDPPGHGPHPAAAAAPVLGTRTDRANLAQVPVIAAAFGFQVMITLYMQRVLGYGAAASGLGLLRTAAVIGTVALGLSARVAARFGPRAMQLARLALVTGGLALLTQIPVHASYPAQLLPSLLIFGVGGGLCLPALASLGMSGTTPAQAGLASGLFNTTQQIGAALGVAVLFTLATAQTRSLHATGAEALADGYRLAFAIGEGLAGAAIVVAATVLRASRRRAALAECC